MTTDRPAAKSPRSGPSSADVASSAEAHAQTEAGSSPGLEGRATDLALAGVHLRLGSLALARAELETLAGRDALDPDGLVDLAEARWRTGDLTGAGDAAEAAIRDGRGGLVAQVIAAEAAAARGRPSEARKLADAALRTADGRIDVLFAGMPRASVWPPDPAAPAPAPTTMFHAPAAPRPPAAAPAAAAALAAGQGASVAGIAAAALAAEATAAGGRTRVVESTAPGLWDATDGTGEGPLDDAELPDAQAELDAGRRSLADGESGAAAHHLALVLRVAPALAPVVLDVLTDHNERDLALVRGDAYRLVGRELEARHAFAYAARPVSDATLADPDPDLHHHRTTAPTDHPEGDPA
ncbi:MAG TPA: hypothetical protein VD763_07540 [Candidatus Saccharimonadales bacterium]|nr:hypothetical protein [Candidatus Saccharimonadales bacterium]